MTPKYRIDNFIGEAGKPGSVTGWSSLEKCQKMADLILKGNLKKVADLGVWGGRSTLALGFAVQATVGKVYACDPFCAAASTEGSNSTENNEWWSKVDYELILKLFTDLVDRHNMLPYINFHRIKSSDMVKFMEDDSLDLIHADGNHSPEVAGEEVRLYYPKLKQGGYWVADDWTWTEYQPVKEVFKELNMDVIYTPPDQQFAILQKGA